jgi:hypothetical protein
VHRSWLIGSCTHVHEQAKICGFSAQFLYLASYLADIKKVRIYFLSSYEGKRGTCFLLDLYIRASN